MGLVVKRFLMGLVANGLGVCLVRDGGGVACLVRGDGGGGGGGLGGGGGGFLMATVRGATVDAMTGALMPPLLSPPGLWVLTSPNWRRRRFGLSG